MKDIVITLSERQNKTNGYECAHVLIENGEGVKQGKIVTMESLLHAFSNSIFKESELIRTGKLPFGYYDGEVGRKQGKLTARVVTVIPADKQVMTYETTRYDVWIPALVFSFMIKEEKLTDTKVFALKDKHVTDKSRLFNYPFGNVNMHNGSVCWGSNVLPNITELKRLEEVMRLFIQSPCNSDYYHANDSCGQNDVSLRQLFEQLQNGTGYPSEFLVPVKKGTGIKIIKDLLPDK